MGDPRAGGDIDPRSHVGSAFSVQLIRIHDCVRRPARRLRKNRGSRCLTVGSRISKARSQGRKYETQGEAAPSSGVQVATQSLG